MSIESNLTNSTVLKVVEEIVSGAQAKDQENSKNVSQIEREIFMLNETVTRLAARYEQAVIEIVTLKKENEDLLKIKIEHDSCLTRIAELEAIISAKEQPAELVEAVPLKIDEDRRYSEESKKINESAVLSIESSFIRQNSRRSNQSLPIQVEKKASLNESLIEKSFVVESSPCEAQQKHLEEVASEAIDRLFSQVELWQKKFEEANGSCEELTTKVQELEAAALRRAERENYLTEQLKEYENKVQNLEARLVTEAERYEKLSEEKTANEKLIKELKSQLAAAEVSCAEAVKAKVTEPAASAALNSIAGFTSYNLNSNLNTASNDIRYYDLTSPNYSVNNQTLTVPNNLNTYTNPSYKEIINSNPVYTNYTGLKDSVISYGTQSQINQKNSISSTTNNASTTVNAYAPSSLNKNIYYNTENTYSSTPGATYYSSDNASVVVSNSPDAAAASSRITKLSDLTDRKTVYSALSNRNSLSFSSLISSPNNKYRASVSNSSRILTNDKSSSGSLSNFNSTPLISNYINPISSNSVNYSYYSNNQAQNEPKNIIITSNAGNSNNNSNNTYSSSSNQSVNSSYYSNNQAQNEPKNILITSNAGNSNNISNNSHRAYFSPGSINPVASSTGNASSYQSNNNGNITVVTKSNADNIVSRVGNNNTLYSDVARNNTSYPKNVYSGNPTTANEIARNKSVYEVLMSGTK